MAVVVSEFYYTSVSFSRKMLIAVEFAGKIFHDKEEFADGKGLLPKNIAVRNKRIFP